MHTVTGHIRNGHIELDDPLPSRWPEGSRVSLTIAETPANELDITGDSPEAIAAWIAWYHDFRALPRNTADADELQDILNQRKAELKAQFESQSRRAEGLFRE
jgi:hypothetical protein